MTPAISVTGLTRRYRDQVALDDVTLDLEPGSITGLLGRNGAGKTTLLRILAGHEFASAGTVTVLGASPVENETVLRQMIFVREDQSYPDLKVRRAVQVASWFYPNWSHELADELLEEFNLPLNRKVRKLSRGMRSALGIVIGLAARAEVTLFDEPYAGLDPVSRQLFYDRLLADYAEHPRTVLLSTHLIDEAAGLFERVVVLDRGRIVLNMAADDLRGAATSVSGPAIAVAEFTAGRPVWDRRRIASQESAVVAGALDETDRARAAALHLHLEPLTLQEVVVQRRGHPGGQPEGKDKRMNTWIKVARYQLTNRYVFVTGPWLILALNFLIFAVVAVHFPAGHGQLRYGGALSAIYIYLIVTGALGISLQLPFALALGVSRRSFYAGTALVAVTLAAIYGLALTVLQLIERATGGWGLDLGFFRVPYFLAGPWYLSWLTSFVGLALMLAWGMWFGIVYRRWNLMGLLSFVAVQVLALTAVLLIVGAAHGWSSVSHFFTTLTIEGLTGLLAALTVALLAGGYATVRRLTV